MKTYRLKQTFEALRWTDTDDDRELFSVWFDRHNTVFETRGPIALLPEYITRGEGDTCDVAVGEWIVWTHNEWGGAFTAMTDEEFRRDYEEIV